MESNNVKLEIDNICRGCLSADRNIKPLSKEYEKIYFNILGEHILCQNTIGCNLLLCWECTSVLKKISIYQKRFLRSHLALVREWVGQFTVETLSHLTICSKNNYDSIFEYNEEQIVDTKSKLDLNKSEEFDIVIKIEKNEDSEIHKSNEEIYLNGEFSNDFDHYYDDINVDTFHEINDKVKKKKKYTRRLVMENVKSYLVNYDNGIVGHVNTVQLKIEHIKDIINQGKKESKNSMLIKMYETLRRRINMVNSDLKPRENNAQSGKLPNDQLLKEQCNEHTVDAFECIYCGVMSIYNSEMLRHLKESHKVNLICECGFECRHRRTYFVHYNKYHKEFVCDHCQIKYSKKEKMEKHMMDKHLPLKCNLCDRVYKKKSSLIAHNWSFHHEYKGEKSELTYCVECDMHFANPFLFKRHLRTAVAHKPRTPKKFPCTECGKIFSKRSYMTNHYNLIHMQKTKYYCEICNKYFSCGFAMRSHKKFVHLKEKKKKDKLCKGCGKCFSTNRELKVHIRTHTGERPFKCSFCDAAFTQEYSRKTHERTQHKGVQKCENDALLK